MTEKNSTKSGNNGSRKDEVQIMKTVLNKQFVSLEKKIQGLWDCSLEEIPKNPENDPN